MVDKKLMKQKLLEKDEHSKRIQLILQEEIPYLKTTVKALMKQITLINAAIKERRAGFAEEEKLEELNQKKQSFVKAYKNRLDEIKKLKDQIILIQTLQDEYDQDFILLETSLEDLTIKEKLSDFNQHIQELKEQYLHYENAMNYTNDLFTLLGEISSDSRSIQDLSYTDAMDFGIFSDVANFSKFFKSKKLNKRIIIIYRMVGIFNTYLKKCNSDLVYKVYFTPTSYLSDFFDFFWSDISRIKQNDVMIKNINTAIKDLTTIEKQLREQFIDLNAKMNEIRDKRDDLFENKELNENNIQE